MDTVILTNPLRQNPKPNPPRRKMGTATILLLFLWSSNSSQCLFSEYILRVD